MATFRYLKELETNEYRMGRHQVHDALLPELEAVFEAGAQPKILSVVHQEFEAPFDQGQLGSCTANAALGCLVTDPFGHPGVGYDEQDAVALYEIETKIDDRQIPGEYPPDDTGSSGPWSMQALEKQGRIRSWRHTRSLHTALRLLNAGPVSIGVPWYQSMFNPDSAGVLVVDPSSGVAGGHQIALTANDVAGQRVLIRNSWGTGWGQDGHAWLDWSDFDALLHDGGDVVQPVL
jgi:hypothetical protein